MNPPPLSQSDSEDAVIDIEICKQSPEVLVNVLKKFGYAHLTNHGIPNEIIDACFKTTLDFFSLPSSIKEKYAKSKSTITYHGYNAKSIGSGNTIREYFHALGDEGNGSKETQTLYPNEIPNMKPAIRRLLHGSEIRSLNTVLLQSIGAAIPTDKITNFLNWHKGILHSDQDKENGGGVDDQRDPMVQSYSYFSSMFYPKVMNVDAEDVDEINGGGRVQRCSAHTDCSTYTLLFLEDGDNALQTFCKTVGNWLNISKVLGSILLIPGDVLETFSNGAISALVHRVPTPTADATLNLKPRQSLPIYILPDSSMPYPNKKLDNNENWTFGQHYEKLIADRYFK